MPAAKITPTQRVALRWLMHEEETRPGGDPAPAANAVPGGIRTVRALVVRGYVVYDHSRVLLTRKGRGRPA